MEVKRTAAHAFSIMITFVKYGKNAFISTVGFKSMSFNTFLYKAVLHPSTLTAANFQ